MGSLFPTVWDYWLFWNIFFKIANLIDPLHIAQEAILISILHYKSMANLDTSMTTDFKYLQRSRANTDDKQLLQATTANYSNYSYPSQLIATSYQPVTTCYLLPPISTICNLLSFSPNHYLLRTFTTKNLPHTPSYLKSITSFFLLITTIYFHVLLLTTTYSSLPTTFYR